MNSETGGTKVSEDTDSQGVPAIVSQTPRVGGFSFVDALPAHDPSSLPAQALQELMTWSRARDALGQTPLRLPRHFVRKYLSLVRLFDPERADRFKESDKREVLAHKMARKAKRSLAESVTGAGRGLATTPGVASIVPHVINSCSA
jgi:hypothetical protein